VILMELSPSARLMAAYAVRKYADSCERNGLDVTELRALGAALGPWAQARSCLVPAGRRCRLHGGDHARSASSQASA